MTYDETTRRQIKDARGKFIAMAVTYGLGVFNDSLFRQSAMLIAVAGKRTYMQNWIMALFTLPYILFASSSGWLADRFSKRHVVIGAKFLELAAMLLGAVGIMTGDYLFTLTMVFLMAWQSCIFSPALNGSIPELYPDAYVTRANANLKVVTTAAILGGISIAGVLLGVQGAAWHGVLRGQLLVGLGVVAISAFGVLVSFGVPKRPAADPKVAFPWSGPVETIKQLALIYKDKLLRVIVIADIFIWFLGTLLVQVINVLAIDQYGYGKDMASWMLAVWVVGVAAGGLIGGRIAVGERWHRHIPACAVGMGVLLVAVGGVPALHDTVTLRLGLFSLPLEVVAIFVLLGLIAVLGGMMLIPCEGFIQRRPEPERKGQVLASVNFCSFGGMMISCGVAYLLDRWMLPTQSFAVVGLATVPLGVWLWRALALEASRKVAQSQSH